MKLDSELHQALDHVAEARRERLRLSQLAGDHAPLLMRDRGVVGVVLETSPSRLGRHPTAAGDRNKPGCIKALHDTPFSRFAPGANEAAGTVPAPRWGRK
jgi:hypothetical protein